MAAMADRNEVLANFQAMSGIEDIAMCLDIMEQKGWDITAALNSVLPENSFESSSSANMTPLQSQAGYVDLTANHHAVPPLIDLTSSASVSMPGPSHSLNVAVPSVATTEQSLGVYYQDRLISLQLPSTTTIAELKERLERETGLPPVNQNITGWPRQPPSANTRLCDLNISSIFHVRLENQPQLEPTTIGAGSIYHHVNSQNNNNDTSVDDLEEVLTRNQYYLQPPPDPPITVESSPTSSTYSDAYEQLSNTEEEEEGEVGPEEGLESLNFEEEEESNVMQDSLRAMKEPLFPQVSSGPSEALQHFMRQFELRYGPMHPLFFIGPLKDAIKEATSEGFNHKPMLIYLHHDGSILSNVFCSQLLCSESVVSYLTNNFITWAWDLTQPQHRLQLLDMILDSFGPSVRSNVSDIHSDHLPAILIVFKSKGTTMDVRNIIQGETNLDSLMTSLITAVEEHGRLLDLEWKEELERIAREKMIAAQNAAYQESLQADQEKVKRKEEQLKMEEEERQEKEAIRQSMASVVPEEPEAGCAEKMSTLRIRLPDGSSTQRRFLASHTVQDLLNYFGSLDYLVQDYKVLRSFPRTDLSSLDPSLSLEEAQLCPQDTLFLEER